MNIQCNLINIHWTPVLGPRDIKIRKFQYWLLIVVDCIAALKYSLSFL